jgi:signal transduction histidine kinase
MEKTLSRDSNRGAKVRPDDPNDKNFIDKIRRPIKLVTGLNVLGPYPAVGSQEQFLGEPLFPHSYDLTGEKEIHLPMGPLVLKEALGDLLKNAVENTPDQGYIEVRLGKKEDRLDLKVLDFGIGISAENQRYLFDGLFHTQDTELYASKKPYDFNAGGKGLGLLQTRLYSRRCSFIPKDMDLCPGDISRCLHCNSVDDCLNSGGSTFCLSFPVSGGKAFDAAGIA